MDPELGPDDIVALNRLTTLAQVLAGTAHDVNNALQIIGGSAELLGARRPAGCGAPRAPPHPESIGAGGVGGRGRHALHPRSRRRHDDRLAERRRDSRHRDAAVPGAPGGLVLDFDAAPSPASNGRVSQLQQAVLNLIMNGEQALTGQLGGTIALTLSEEAGDAVMRIVDNGPGPDRALGEHAFDAFVTTRSRTESPGLGLAAARIIARAHGGDVTLDDRKPGAVRPSGCRWRRVAGSRGPPQVRRYAAAGTRPCGARAHRRTVAQARPAADDPWLWTVRHDAPDPAEPANFLTPRRSRR